jgi:hypothetical protein
MMTPGRTRAGRRGIGRRGIAALEFAIVVPVFVLLFVGIFETMRMLLVQDLLEFAAREASRSGMTGAAPPPGQTREDVIRDLVDDISSGLLEPAALTVSMVSYDSFTNIRQPEPFIDSNGNGRWNTGEPFTDVNGNCKWDPDQGTSGLGAGGHVVIYTLSYRDRPITGLFAEAVGRDRFNYEARVVVRNEPYQAGGAGPSC